MARAKSKKGAKNHLTNSNEREKTTNEPFDCIQNNNLNDGNQKSKSKTMKSIESKRQKKNIFIFSLNFESETQAAEGRKKRKNIE